MKSFLFLALTLASAPACAQTKPLTLEQAVQEAFSTRATIRSAQLRVDQARSTRRSLAAKPPTELRVGYSSDINVGGTDDDLTLAQPIDAFGRSAAFKASGDALVRQAEGLLIQAKTELQSSTIDAYLDAAASIERLKIARDAESAAEQLLIAIKGLVEGGRAPGVQAARVSIELARARSNAKQREADRGANERRLSGILGVDLRVDVVAFPDIQTPNVSDEKLSLQRADLIALSAESSIAEAEARVARVSRMPQLEFQGRRSPWQDSSGQYGLRVQLSFPLYDSGRARADIKAADLHSRAAKESLSDLLRLAHSEIDASLIEVHSAQERVSSLEAVLDDTRKLFERTQVGLKEGANTLLDTLDALRSIREVREEIVEAKLSLGRAQAKYLAATGSLLEVRS